MKNDTKADAKASQGRHAADTQVQDTVQVDGQSAQPSDFPSAAPRKKRGRKALKVFGIVLGSLLGLAVLAYAAGCFYFSDRFFPDTVIGEYDVSLKTSAEAEEVLQAALGDYGLSVEGQGLSFKLDSEEIGLTLDSEAIVAQALEGPRMWMWPLEMQEHHDLDSVLAASYDKATLLESVKEQVDSFNETATQPGDATVAYDEASRKFQVAPEVPGTALDPEAVAEVAGKAASTMERKATVASGELLKPPVLSDDPMLAASCEAANELLVADFTLVAGSAEAAIVGPDRISSWIVFDEDLNPSFDENLMIAWVDELAAGFNTIGTERTFTRADGKEVTVAGGTYGWSADRDTLLTIVKEGLESGQTGTVEIPVLQSADLYAGAGERDWAGYVDVDLSEQYARYYDDAGNVIWETAIITGKPNAEMATPTGVYYVTTKTGPTTLNTYESGRKEPKKTVVQYWMPFVGNVIGLHDAWWQPGFGGTMYRDGYGSHGCVNLPSAKAQELYGILPVGEVVIVHW